MARYKRYKGMSINAMDAYEKGKKPISNITTADLKKHGIEISLALTKYIAQKKHIGRTEWHHTGYYANETSFYDLDLISDFIKTRSEEELKKLEEEYKEYKKKKSIKKSNL